MPEADSSDLKTCGSQVTIFTLKTLQVMRSMEQFFLCGRAPNGFLNQLLVEAPSWEFLLNNCLKTKSDQQTLGQLIQQQRAQRTQRTMLKRLPALCTLCPLWLLSQSCLFRFTAVFIWMNSHREHREHRGN